ncbi:tryptophan-rich sensory protein [Tersicoccus sp. MR15.9]|uniref:tryptophan-rich sensory protein n=1 Tax=Tersicoccus mangrovi TaxID=3121635 RepID=UPI002FE69254
MSSTPARHPAPARSTDRPDPGRPRRRRRSDVTRQVVVLVCLVLALAGSAWGSGAFGGSGIQNAASGALGPDATLLAPARPAFAIWSVIYLGLTLYAVWQALPRQRTNPRQRDTGYTAAVSMLLNAGWILVAQAGWLPLTVPVIVALLVVLVVLYRRLITGPNPRPLEAVLVDGTFGLYLGWVSVATTANVTAALAGPLAAAGLDLDGGAVWWAILVIAVVAVVGAGLALSGDGRVTPALALAWGLAWIAVSRLDGTLRSTPTAVTAIAAAVLILGWTALVRGLTTRRRRPA